MWGSPYLKFFYIALNKKLIIFIEKKMFSISTNKKKCLNEITVKPVILFSIAFEKFYSQIELLYFQFAKIPLIGLSFFRN
jgi:hypothetical protein